MDWFHISSVVISDPSWYQYDQNMLLVHVCFPSLFVQIFFAVYNFSPKKKKLVVVETCSWIIRHLWRNPLRDNWTRRSTVYAYGQLCTCEKRTIPYLFSVCRCNDVFLRENQVVLFSAPVLMWYLYILIYIYIHTLFLCFFFLFLYSLKTCYTLSLWKTYRRISSQIFL